MVRNCECFGKHVKTFRPFDKQKWYDSVCMKYRTRSFKLINIFLKNNSDYVKRLYLVAKKQCMKICRD